MTTFPPSAVRADIFPPFVGTFNRSEAENAAAALVWVCQKKGEWGPVHARDIGDLMKEDFAAVNERARFWRNPFVRVDIHRLIADGFAEWTDAETVRFTDAGMKRLARWVPADLKAPS